MSLHDDWEDFPNTMKGMGQEVADLRAQLAAAEAARGRVEAVVTAARALMDKMVAVHHHPKYESVWFVNQIHTGPYEVPTYEPEMQALTDALAALDAAGERGEG